MPKLDDFFRLSASRAELARIHNFSAIRLSRADRMANGKALRSNVPRSSHAEFRRAHGRPDPVSILEAQNATRIKELVPVRMARMLTSPFAFLRGSAAIMAGDLANTPRTNLEVMACGDMHLVISDSSHRRSATSFSQSTILTRFFPGHGSGTSSGWPRALRLLHSFSAATGLMPSRQRARWSKPMSGGCAAMPRWISWKFGTT